MQFYNSGLLTKYSMGCQQGYSPCMGRYLPGISTQLRLALDSQPAWGTHCRICTLTSQRCSCQGWCTLVSCQCSLAAGSRSSLSGSQRRWSLCSQESCNCIKHSTNKCIPYNYVCKGLYQDDTMRVNINVPSPVNYIFAQSYQNQGKLTK